jgi:amidase
MNELTFLPAYQLAQKIRDRIFSAGEVLDAYLTQIAKYNAKLNAIVTLDEERSRQRAQAADEALARGECWGALHGVPITIKDNLETALIRTTVSYKALANYIPERDATAVARLKAAGAIIIGKTNLPALASDYQSNSPVFGRANNPWNVNYTPGGSTGGGAAAVAAGLSPLELGSDIGGSIRQPAHFCGIFGFKPTERRVSTAGHLPELPGMPKTIRHLLNVGALARSVEDLRLCLSIIAGADDRQPEIPPVSLNITSERAIEDLRIAWTDDFGGIPVMAEIRTAIETVANKLAGVGCKVERWTPPEFDFVEAWENYGEVVSAVLRYAQLFSWDAAVTSITLMIRDRIQGEAKYRTLSPLKNAWRNLLNPTLRGYFKALTTRDRAIIQMDRALSQWDAWLCPVAATTAYTHRRAGKAISVDKIELPYMLANGAYTTIFNLTGSPVVTVPIGLTKDGLPIGIQIVGKRWTDMSLLAIAQQVSQVADGFQRPPGYEA